MRYLVTARVKEGKEESLERAIEDGTLGAAPLPVTNTNET